MSSVAQARKAAASAWSCGSATFMLWCYKSRSHLAALEAARVRLAARSRSHVVVRLYALDTGVVRARSVALGLAASFHTKLRAVIPVGVVSFLLALDSHSDRIGLSRGLLQRAVREDGRDGVRCLDLPDQGRPGPPFEDEASWGVRSEASVGYAVDAVDCVGDWGSNDEEVVGLAVARACFGRADDAAYLLEPAGCSQDVGGAVPIAAYDPGPDQAG